MERGRVSAFYKQRMDCQVSTRVGTPVFEFCMQSYTPLWLWYCPNNIFAESESGLCIAKCLYSIHSLLVWALQGQTQLTMVQKQAHHACVLWKPSTVALKHRVRDNLVVSPVAPLGPWVSKQSYRYTSRYTLAPRQRRQLPFVATFSFQSPNG